MEKYDAKIYGNSTGRATAGSQLPADDAGATANGGQHAVLWR